jgi:hypothetical protein
MSTLAVNTITDAAGGNTAQINGMTPTADSLQGFRNRIINGDMRIDQRNAGASVTVNSGSPAYTLDRFAAQAINSAGVFTVQQDSSAPVGFVNSLKVTVTTTDAAPSTRYRIYQNIEGTNTSDFGWGTANAQAVTLSFWVRSSVTGTFGGALQNSASNRSYPFTYSVSSANTWEYKTVSVTGDTSGTWLTTTSTGIGVSFSLGANASLSGTAGVWAGADYRSATGATNLMATSGATFYITGVQLEAGSVATPFERIDYGRQLIQCQRYCQVYGASMRWAIYAAQNTSFETDIIIPTMRATPTVSGQTNSSFGGTTTVTGTLPSAVRYEIATGSATGGRYGAFALGYTLSAEL